MQAALISAVLIGQTQDARGKRGLEAEMLVLLHKKMIYRIFATVMGPQSRPKERQYPSWKGAKGTLWH